MALLQVVEEALVLQVAVEHPLEIVQGDHWLFAKIVVLQIQDQLRLIIHIFMHFFEP
jgi:hypothetical protein